MGIQTTTTTTTTWHKQATKKRIMTMLHFNNWKNFSLFAVLKIMMNAIRRQGSLSHQTQQNTV